MQLTTLIGTFLVLAVPEHPDALEVRSDNRGDLLRLRAKHLPDVDVEPAGPAFRVVVARDEWVHALEHLTARIDYVDFTPPA